MRIEFSFETKYGRYLDALHIPDDQPMPSIDELNTMKRERVTNWMAAVEEASNIPAQEDPPADQIVDNSTGGI